MSGVRVSIVLLIMEAFEYMKKTVGAVILKGNKLLLIHKNKIKVLKIFHKPLYIKYNGPKILNIK